MVHEFKVPVGLDEKTISVMTDQETGKAAIRVDGKVVGRPIGPDEDSREIQVGDGIYEIRRNWDQFEIEYLGAADPVPSSNDGTFAGTGASGMGSGPLPDSGRPVWRGRLAKLGGLVLGFLVIATIPVYRSAYSGWEPYANPDGTFSCVMPGKPELHKEFFTFPGGASYEYTLSLVHGPNEYVVSYFNLPRDFNHSHDGEVIDALKGFLREEYRGEVLFEERSDRKAELRMRVRDIDTDKPEEKKSGDVRFELRILNNRVYIIGALAPFDKLNSPPVFRFLSSFRIDDKPLLDLPAWLPI